MFKTSEQSGVGGNWRLSVSSPPSDLGKFFTVIPTEAVDMLGIRIPIGSALLAKRLADMI